MCFVVSVKDTHTNVEDDGVDDDDDDDDCTRADLGAESVCVCVSGERLTKKAERGSGEGRCRC